MRLRSSRFPRRVFVCRLALIVAALAQGWALADDKAPQNGKSQKKLRADIKLSAEQKRKLHAAVDRALEYLVAQQARDGSFAANRIGQPAVSSLCIMSFLSRGYKPLEGRYSEELRAAIDYVLTSQRKNGLLCSGTSRDFSLAGSYNHAIAGVMLGEAYDMTDSRQHPAIRSAIERALVYSREQQTRRKRWPDDTGGWRYFKRITDMDSDLSITAWHLMFYCSAKKAGFAVADEHIQEALAYVERCYDADMRTFAYGLRDDGRDFTRGMAGAGIVSLALAGKNNTDMAKDAARFVLEHPFDRFNDGGLSKEDRFFYSAYYCSQGMFHLGGEFWANFYPVLLETLTENQNADGSWDVEAVQDANIGQAYSTALAILALTPPYQELPIHQR
jgi:hypothetical protein